MVEVHLYGKLRQYAAEQEVTGSSIVEVSVKEEATIADVLRRIGIHPAEVSHLFLNAQYSALTRRVQDGDRLGVFPRDMGLLYRQYFPKFE
ncbi:MAG: MoaD/ThiS family protein [Anaerolineae bacterium]